MNKNRIGDKMTKDLEDRLKSIYKEDETRLGIILKGTLASFLKIEDSEIKLDNISPTLTGVRATFSVGDLRFDLCHPENTTDIIINGSPMIVKNLVDVGRILQIQDNKIGR